MKIFSLLLLLTATLCTSAHNLLGQWTFENGDLKDLTGNFGDITLKGAVITNGQLDLGAGKWATAGHYNGPTINEKTLVSWVSIDSFSVQRGSVLTIDKVTVDQFDAIVLGERQINHWMAGSSGFHRTIDPNPGFKETQLNVMIQIAISYENDNGNAHVRLYRDGVKIGDYTKGPFVNWPKGDAEIFWGIRHGTVNGGPDNMDAHIEESRIYDGVLTAEDLKRLKPKRAVSLLGQWTFEKGEELKDLTGHFCSIRLRGADISNGQLDLGANAWAVTGHYKGPTIYEKTLVSWVSIDSLSVQGGSVLTIDKVTVDQFDAIVLGERQINRWMAGSSGFHRTIDPNPGFKETQLNIMIQIAISYENDNGNAHVRLYRDGVKIGDYTKGPFVNWPKGDAEIFWGIRHGNAVDGGPDNMDAHIEESRIYGDVLTAEELKQLKPVKNKAYNEEMKQEYMNSIVEEYDIEEPAYDGFYQD